MSTTKQKKRFQCSHGKSYGKYCHTCKSLEDGILVEDIDGKITSVVNPANDKRKGRKQKESKRKKI